MEDIRQLCIFVLDDITLINLQAAIKSGNDGLFEKALGKFLSNAKLFDLATKVATRCGMKWFYAR